MVLVDCPPPHVYILEKQGTEEESDYKPSTQINWDKWPPKKMGGEQEAQSGRKGCYYSTLCHPPLNPSVSTRLGNGRWQFPLGADINQTLKGCLLCNSWGKMERLITHIINFHRGLAHVTHMDLFEMGCQTLHAMYVQWKEQGRINQTLCYLKKKSVFRSDKHIGE